ncbi:hypothetical protein D3C72_1989700 [compost metagenome]
MQGRQLQEDVCHHADQYNHDTRHQHSAEERHVFTGRQDVSGAAEEHQCRTTQRHANHITHPRRQIGVEDRSQDITQEAGESERRQNTNRFVSGFVGQEHQTIHAHQCQNQARRRQHQHGAGRCGNGGKRQGQAEHEIGIAQHFVGAE